MTKQRIILVVIVCFSGVILAAQTRSSAFKERRFPPRKPGMTDEEYSKEIMKLMKEPWEKAEQERRRSSEERRRLMRREAWKRLLRVGEQRWKIIKLTIDNMDVFAWRASVRTSRSSNSTGSLGWKRPSRDGGPMSGKTREQMPEGFRIIEELIDLLEDENSKDEEIRKKMDALQQVRKNALKEWAAVAGQELVPLLTTPRQEAVFLLMGRID